jgi:ribosomal protein S18 acetylase RimI-like enzyme
MSISLRKARLDDVDALTELWIEFIDFHQDFDSFFSRAKKGHERFADFVRENPPVFDMKLYGFIQDLAVTESHRRRGAGSRLVEETLRWFRKQGVKRVEVQVATTNPLSQAFWRRHDFVDYITRLARQI